MSRRTEAFIAEPPGGVVDPEGYDDWVDVDAVPEPELPPVEEEIMERFMEEFPEAKPVAEAKKEWRPDKGDYISVRGGGQYLNVKKRLIWLRQEPDPHPLWGIETFIREHVPNEYAVVQAYITDESGRVIATGIKMEHKKDFPDYLEKAETGAIGRALAAAGYGTESSMEFDEGIGADGEPRIADAPVKVSITPSSVSGIKQGGRSEFVTNTQIKEIARLTRETGLNPEEVVTFLMDLNLAPDDALDAKNWPLDIEGQNRVIVGHIRKLTFEQAGTLIQGLAKSLAA